MDRAEEDALAEELLVLVAEHLDRAGLGMADEVVGRILASMLAGHYAVRGVWDRYDLIDYLHDRLDIVDEARAGTRNDIPGVER